MAKLPSRRALDLIGSMAAESANELFGLCRDSPRLRDIELDHIDPNPDQPRQHFDAADLAELADSIARHGLLQPILVRQHGERFMLVAGERRLRARRLLGEALIPAIITTGDPAEIALVENLQRCDLDPFELASGLARLKQRHGYSDAEMGRVIGRSQTETSRCLRLLELPETIQQEWRQDFRHIPRNTLYEIGFAGSVEQQLALWQQAKSGATVTAVRRARRGDVADAPPINTVIEQRLGRLEQQIKALHRIADLPATLTAEQQRRLESLRQQITALLAPLQSISTGTGG